MLESDPLVNKLESLQLKISHSESMVNFRLLCLEEQIRDHETRLRAATEGITQFKVFSGLASGSSSILSIIALIKTFLSL